MPTWNSVQTTGHPLLTKQDAVEGRPPGTVSRVQDTPFLLGCGGPRTVSPVQWGELAWGWLGTDRVGLGVLGGTQVRFPATAWGGGGVSKFRCRKARWLPIWVWVCELDLALTGAIKVLWCSGRGVMWFCWGLSENFSCIPHLTGGISLSIFVSLLGSGRLWLIQGYKHCS